MGASGSGKSEWVKRELRAARPRRLLIWSPLEATDRYSEFAPVCRTLAAAARIVAAAGARGAFAVCFVPAGDDKARAAQFDFICRLASAAKNLTLVVEELKFVTRPSWSPMAWAAITLQGRHHGLTVYGTSQRPAHIDKDFLSNCTVIHTGMLGETLDLVPVANAMRLDAKGRAALEALRPLEWMQKTRATGALTRGKLTF